MKKTIIRDWTSYFLGICALSGLLLFSSCDSDRSTSSESTYAEEQQAPVGDTQTTDTVNAYDRTSNTVLEQGDMDMTTPRSQAAESAPRGTSAAPATESNTTNSPATRQDEQAMQPQQQDDEPLAKYQNVKARSEFDIRKLRMDFEELNREIIKTLRQYPDIRMRFTDNLEGADYNYGTYGVTYENLTDETARKQFQDLELRRSELLEQMRGQMDTETGTYMAAEEDARPTRGYNTLYEFIAQELQYPRNLRSEDIQGTMFIEFRVDEKGQVSDAKVIETLDASAIRLQNNELSPAPSPIQREVNQDEFEAIISELEEEVKEVILKTSGLWEPAKMNGEAVSEYVQLPIHFYSGPEEAAIENK